MAQPAIYHNPISLVLWQSIDTSPFVADADREKLEQCDSKYARYLCKIMDVYFDYHKDAYFIKGLHTLISSKEVKNGSVKLLVVGTDQKLCNLVTWLHIELLTGVYLHDPTTLIAAVNPSLLTYTEGVVRVQTVGITKGLTVFDNTKKRLGYSLCLSESHVAETVAVDSEMKWFSPNSVAL